MIVADGEPTRRTVLIVTDRPGVADRIESSIGPTIECSSVRSTDGFRDALGPATDLVIVDRRLGPDRSDRLLDVVRSAETAARVGVIVEEEFPEALVETGYDDVLDWPADLDSIRDSIDRLLAIREYDDRLDEYIDLLRERNTAPADASTLGKHRRSIDRRIDEIESRIDPLARSFDDRAVTVLLRDLESPQASLS